MKTPLQSIAALAVVTFALSSAFAADPAESTEAKPGTSAKLAEANAAKATSPTAAKPAATPVPEKRHAPARIKYVPPAGSLGSATNNSAGGTRGGGDKLPTLSVLAPGRLALTTQAHPVLYWYQSAPAKNAKFEITLIEPKKPKPLVNRTTTADFAGIVGLPLEKYGVTLAPGVEYQWHVALIPDANNRSKDAVATGTIKRVAAPAGLEEKLAKASPEEQAALYAQGGIWYDALQVISSAITRNPRDSALHKERAELLQQGGLPDVAKAEAR